MADDNRITSKVTSDSDSFLSARFAAQTVKVGATPRS